MSKETNQVANFTKVLENDKMVMIGFQNLTNFLNGEMKRLKNGNLKLEIELPSEVMSEKCNGIPLRSEDWTIQPIITFLKDKE